jgi:hypothetical protein
MNRKPKYILGIVGILLTIAGWSVSNSDQLPVVQKLVSPRYKRAMSAYKALHNKGAILNQSNEGFQEIVATLKEDITGPVEPMISSLKTLDWGTAAVNTDQGIQWQQYLELEISFSNAKPISGKIRRLQRRIEARYQKKNLFAWSTGIFWLGIAISLLALFWETNSQQKAGDPTLDSTHSAESKASQP